MDVSSVGSGYYDYAALQARFQQSVTEADADDSGGLSFAEFEELEASRSQGSTGVRGDQKTTEERFSSLDSNGDGEVTLEEFEAGAKSFMPSFSSSNLTELLAVQEANTGSDSGSDASDDLIKELFDRLQSDETDDDQSIAA